MKKNSPISNDNYLKSSAKVMLLLLLATIPVLLLINSGNHQNYIVFFVILILFLPIIYEKDLFHPLFLFIALQTFVIINFLDNIINENAIAHAQLLLGEDRNYYINYSLIVITVWYVLLYFGFYFARMFKMNFRLIEKLQTYSVYSYGKIGVLFVILGFASFVYTVYHVGGLNVMIEQMGDRRELYAGLGYLKRIVGVGSIGAILLLIAGYKKSSFMLTLFFTLLLAMYGGRGTALYNGILPYIITYHYVYKNINYLIASAFIFVGLIFSQLFLNLRQGSEGSIGNEGLIGIFLEAGSSLSTANILPALILHLDSGYATLLYGGPLLNIFQAPIPSTIYEGKPIIHEAAIVGQTLLGSDYYGLPPGTYGWAYFNFSWFGILVLGVITGIVIQKFYKYFIGSNNSLLIAFYSTTVLSVIDIIYTSAQIEIIWTTFVFILIVILDKLFAVRKRSHKIQLK